MSLWHREQGAALLELQRQGRWDWAIEAQACWQRGHPYTPPERTSRSIRHLIDEVNYLASRGLKMEACDFNERGHG